MTFEGTSYFLLLWLFLLEAPLIDGIAIGIPSVGGHIKFFFASDTDSAGGAKRIRRDLLARHRTIARPLEKHGGLCQTKPGIVAEQIEVRSVCRGLTPHFCLFRVLGVPVQSIRHASQRCEVVRRFEACDGRSGS